MILPIFSLMCIVGIPATILTAIDEFINKLAHRYEAWSFSSSNDQAVKQAIRQSIARK